MTRHIPEGMATDPGIAGRPYRRLRAQVMAPVDEGGDPDHCVICGHWGGANELDHLEDRALGGAPLDRDNVGRAHGTSSRCPQCPPQANGLPRACNQTKHSVAAPAARRATSRVW